jgi:excisionase family DNA binding protein
MLKKPTWYQMRSTKPFGKMSRKKTGEVGAQERIKIKDVASNCMVSQTTVRRWIENGQLRAIRLPSGHYRINQADYKLFLENCEIAPEKGATKSKH